MHAKVTCQCGESIARTGEHDQSINDIVECDCGLKYALTVTRVVE
ncbi:hypothetical protein [Halorubrum sp. DTA98]